MALRGGRRHVAASCGVPRPPAAHRRVASPTRSYLVTGGLGGLGLKIARWMAAAGAGHDRAHRSPRPARPRAAGTSSTRQPRGRQQVGRDPAIEALGATVAIVAADVADVRQR